MSDDLTRRNEELDRFAANTPFVQSIIKSQRRSRLGAIITAIVVVVDLLVTAGAIRDYVHQRDLDQKTAAIVVQLRRDSESIYDACIKRNIGRANQIQLWVQTIKNSPPPRAESAAAKQVRVEQTKAFYKRLTTIFAPEKCPPGGIR